MNHHRARGFTMVELLIVIVIVSILAAVAVPSYREYVIRTDRTVGKVALQDLATRQESYAVDHKRYAATFNALGIPFSGSALLLRDGTFTDQFAQSIYLLSLHTAAEITMSTCASTVTAGASFANGFAIVATPTGDVITAPTTGLKHKDPKCGTLCVNSRGERGASGGTDDCWRR